MGFQYFVKNFGSDDYRIVNRQGKFVKTKLGSHPGDFMEPARAPSAATWMTRAGAEAAAAEYDKMGLPKGMTVEEAVMNPKEKTWLKSCIDYLLKMHGGGESIRMINVAFMPERPAGVFPDDEKAKQALFSEIARVAEEGKLLKPQPIGDIWHRPGKPPLVMKVESSAGMARLSRLVEGVPEQHQLKIAISTLKMPDAMVGVMGGPNKEQARDILRKNGWSDARIAALEEKTESRLSRVVEKEYEFEMGDPVRIVGNVDGKGKSGKVDYSKNGFAVVVDKNGKGIGSFHWSDLKLKSEEGAWPLMSEPSR